MYQFQTGVIRFISVGNMSEAVRYLTNPQIVRITCSYLWGLNLNRCWTNRNIFTERMRCSANTSLAENF